MKTIELNEQAVSFLIEMLNRAIDEKDPIGGSFYGETPKAIMRHILSKLEDIPESNLEEVDLEEIKKHEDNGVIINELSRN